MEILVFLLGGLSLAATTMLALFSVPKKDRKRLHVVLAVLACATGGGVLIVQSALGIAGARETKTLLTGGDAYAYVVPQTHDPNLSLRIVNESDNTLPGIAVEMVDMSFDQGDPPTRPTINVGTLPPHTSQVLKAAFTPTPGADGEASYMFLITAANGEVTESLQFRRGHNALPWAYKLNVARQVRIDAHSGRADPLMGRGWSDDLGDGVPTQPPANDGR